MNRQKITSPSLGVHLRQARERHGRSIQEAAHILHIPLRQLEALESDSAAGAFAAPVYAFGALKSYATWLGLPSEPLERMLSMQLRAADVGRSDLKVHTLPKWYENLITPRTIIAVSGTMVALVIGSYVLWQVRSFWQLPSLVITEPVDAVVNEDRVIIQGTTERDAKLQINGEQVPLQNETVFSQEIPLSYGITIIRVAATNAAGRTKVVAKHLLRPENPSTLR